MPSSTFKYTGGKTISAAMNSGSVRLESQISARMMNDATGTVLTAATNGASSSLTRENRAESAASTTASAQESKKPPKMCMLDVPMARQNTAVPASVQSRASEDTGEGSSSAPCGYAACSAIAASCQTISQKATAQRRTFCFFPRMIISPFLEIRRRDSARRRKEFMRNRSCYPASRRRQRRETHCRAPLNNRAAPQEGLPPSDRRCCSRAVPFPRRRRPRCRIRR